MATVLKRFNRGKKESHVTTTKEEEVKCSLLLSLPTYIIFDILVTLPVYTIFSCKCVCQTFKNILSDPYFAEAHLAKSPGNNYSVAFKDGKNPSTIIFPPMLDLDKPAKYSKTNNNLYNSEYYSWLTLNTAHTIPRIKSDEVLANIVGSCNGLLFLQYFEDKGSNFRICNPVLGELMIIPQCDERTLCGFGFCPKTKHYKVIRFICKTRDCEILTLGTDEWRKINDSPQMPDSIYDFDASYRGHLHWVVKRVRICSFNLETEKYFYMPLPSCFNEVENLRMCHIPIGTLDGLLCVGYKILPDQFELYVMEEHGVKESWIKKASIDLRHHFELQSAHMLGFLDNGALMLRVSDTRLVYYDTRKGTNSDIILEEGYIWCMAYVPSLTSLKDIVKRENVEQVERKMVHFFPSGKRLGKRAFSWRRLFTRLRNSKIASRSKTINNGRNG